MKKVFFLVNSLAEFTFGDLLKRYLAGIQVSVGESLPLHTEEYDLVVLWSYRKIIHNVAAKRNIIVFHSSDLPEGRGWAPIYYALSEGSKLFVISGICASEEVDKGDIIVKARFRIRDNYTAEAIRQWDNEISIMLTREILNKFEGREIQGIPQVGNGIYRPRRNPDDNVIPFDARLCDVIGHLQACEKDHPAFFYFHQTKYLINVEPERKPEFPDDLEITFFIK